MDAVADHALNVIGDRSRDVARYRCDLVEVRTAEKQRVEKLLDDAAKTAGKTSSSEPVKPAKPASSTSLAFPDSFAAATPGDPPAPSPRKN